MQLLQRHVEGGQQRLDHVLVVLDPVLQQLERALQVVQEAVQVREQDGDLEIWWISETGEEFPKFYTIRACFEHIYAQFSV